MNPYYLYSNPYDYPPPRKSKTGIIIGAVVALLILLVIGYFIYIALNPNSSLPLAGSLPFLQKNNCQVILSRATAGEISEAIQHSDKLPDCIKNCNDAAKAYVHAFASMMPTTATPEGSPERRAIALYVATLDRTMVDKFGDAKYCQTQVNAEMNSY
jgi:hypothetical protein